MPKQCPNCQQMLDESARFCPICGHSVGEVKPLDSPIEISREQLPSPLIPESTEPLPAAAPETQQVPPLPPPLLPQPMAVTGSAEIGKPALMAGIILGAASALPLISCCCWIWVVVGGTLAVFFLRREFAGEITAGLGAKLGLLTGMVGALVWELMSIPLSFIARQQGVAQLQSFLDSANNLPPEATRFFELFIHFLSNPLHPLVLIFGLMSKLLICALFTTLGGLLGVAFFGKPKVQS